jgi:ubiquinol-cytochrome c reductase core subunit 2
MTKQQPAAQDIHVTKQPNGVVVASVENHSPVSRLAVYMNAGPRNERPEEVGICHVLRNAANFTTQGASAFGLVKNIQQMGANFTCSTTREYMVYNLECTRDKLDNAVEYLADVTCKPVYFPWEISDSSPRFLLDRALLEDNPLARLNEALHRAAYRDGLGRSLYICKHKIGKFSSEMMADYFLRNYTGSNMALVGVGIDQETLTRLSSKFRFENNAKGVASGTGYHGGEVRNEGPGPLVHAAIVTEGAGMDKPECLALSVLQQAMGTGPFIKYSSTPATSRVGKAAAQATENPVAASCIMSAYSDSGLFGFQVSCLADDADKVLRSVKNAFADATKGSFTDQDVAVAKEQLKASYLMWAENSANILEDIGTQAVSLGAVSPVEDILKQIDGVTVADVNKAAKKFINGKPTMAAVGNISKTPYLDQLL